MFKTNYYYKRRCFDDNVFIQLSNKVRITPANIRFLKSLGLKLLNNGGGKTANISKSKVR